MQQLLNSNPQALRLATEEEMALMAVISWWRRFPVTRALLAVVVVVCVWSAVALLFAPDAQLFTQGTSPAFELFPPVAWAGLFAAGGAATVLLLLRFTLPRMFAAGVGVLPVQAMWLAASALAVTNGGGSALGVVFFTGLVLFTFVTVVAVGVDYSSGKR